jgi:RNA polymerase sigma-70 factor (ECF subfamily)
MSTAAMTDFIDETAKQEYEDIFREHYRLVYRTAFRITGRAEDTEDVVQTVFLRLLRRGLPADFYKNPKGYLYRAAVNLSLNVVESRNRFVLDNETVFREPGTTPPDTNSQSYREWFSGALLKLRPRAVEIFLLRYEQDYTDVEIAKMLGTSRGVIAVSLFRSRARLRKLLRGYKEKQS